MKDSTGECLDFGEGLNEEVHFWGAENRAACPRDHMSVRILIDAQYPRGPAGAKRVQSFARGLRASGCDARIIGLDKACEVNSDHGWARDPYGVPYRLIRHSGGRWGRAGRAAHRLFSLAAQYKAAIAAERRAGHCDAVILYGHSWRYFMPTVKWCRKVGVTVAADWNEWWRFSWQCTHLYCDQELYRLRLLPAVDGIIAISQTLEDYALARKQPVIRIPAMDDDRNRSEAVEPHSGCFTLLYVGEMARRDLPSAMLAGLREAVNRGMHCRFVVVGPVGRWPEAKEARAEVMTCPVLKGRVEFTGPKYGAELDRQHAAADAFVLMRDDDRESRACFPTRLPEYLLAEKPVIISRVGDIPLFLQHRRDAWLLPPGRQPKALADALVNLAVAPAEARQIGRLGRETALKDFSCLPHGIRLKEFLQRIGRKAC